MAQYADEKCYEDMIAALQKFIEDVSEACDDMSRAGNDCVDNMENDPAAAKSNAKLQTCISDFRATTQTAQKVISGMQKQLEDIRRIVSNADSDD